ncbi:MAG: hypothetical protein ACLUHE_02095 [Christensenellales bacterium]
MARSSGYGDERLHRLRRRRAAIRMNADENGSEDSGENGGGQGGFAGGDRAAFWRAESARRGEYVLRRHHGGWPQGTDADRHRQRCATTACCPVLLGFLSAGYVSSDYVWRDG